MLRPIYSYRLRDSGGVTTDETVPKAVALWLVAGCALVAAVAGPFVADLSTTTPPTPQGAPQSYLNFYSGPLFIIFLYGAPIAALVAASVAYAGLVLRRPRVLAVAGVLAGLVAAYLVGWGTQGIADWWGGLSHDTNRVAAIVAVVVSLLVVPSVALSAKFPILHAAASRRGVVAAVLSLSVLCGLFVGLLVGGEAAALTSLQYTCPPGAKVCDGSNIESALAGGAFLGMWFGGAAGLLVGAIVWAIPPWSVPKRHLATSEPSTD